MFYNENYLRQKKLSRILNEKIYFTKNDKDKRIFYQKWSNGYLYCDYDIIWSFFEENYIDNYKNIFSLITWILESNDKTKSLIPFNYMMTRRR